MAYDEKLAARVRQVVGPRVGPEHHQAALARAHVRPMDFTGRPMTGYVFVGPAGSRTAKDVKRWTDQATAFVATLESKGKKRRT